MDSEIIMAAWGERWDLIGAAGIMLTIIGAAWAFSNRVRRDLGSVTTMAEHTASALEHQATAQEKTADAVLTLAVKNTEEHGAIVSGLYDAKKDITILKKKHDEDC